MSQEKRLHIVKEYSKKALQFNSNKFNLDLKNHVTLTNDFFEITNFLDHRSPSNNERFFCIKNDIMEIPKCKNCGMETTFKKENVKYNTFCSVACSRNNIATKEKQKKTNLIKYGVDHNFKSKECQSKREETFIKKYGVKNPAQSKIIGKKISVVNNGKYYEEVILKSKYLEPLFKKNEWTSSKNSHKFKCKKCQNIFENTGSESFNNIKCPKCYISHHTSQAHKEIEEYIKSLGITNIVMNTRKIISPLELDIYLPDNKLAIEYNGLYWHSSNSKETDSETKNRHLVKIEACEQKGVQLLHIFENEWLNKQEIVKSIISSKLQVNEKIYARKCVVAILTPKEKRNFLNDSHLQGDSNSSANLALKYNDEIVCCLTIGKPRYNKNYCWEIVRFANKLNVNVVGGFSRLLSNFRKNYSGSIISYADRRYSTGILYRVNGFIEKEDSQICYFYFKNNDIKLKHRSTFQKHKLKDLLEVFDKNLTEVENMYNNDYRRIWDCGNKVFILNSQ